MMRGLGFVVFFLGGLLSCRGEVGFLQPYGQQHGAVHAVELKGRVAASGSRNRHSVFQYDLKGRPLSVRHNLDGRAYVYDYTYGYVGGPGVDSELGEVPTKMRFPDLEEVVSDFDAVGNAQHFTASLSRHAVSYRDQFLNLTKRNRFGQVEWTDHADHTRTLLDYNEARQIRHVVTVRKTDGEILQAFGYTYDTLQRVTQVRDYCAQTENSRACCDPRDSSCTEGPLSATYRYNVAGWLESMSSMEGTQTFQVDAIGNLLQKHDAFQRYAENAPAHAVTSVVDLRGHLTAHYEYNRVGAMTSMQEDGVLTKLTWNAHNMPVRTEQKSNLTERSYLGEALYKRMDFIDGKTSTTLFLPGMRIENGTVRKFYGGSVERESTAGAPHGTLRFHHGDHLGSATLVTDERGFPVSRAAFYPYGEQRFREGTFRPKQQFTSKEKEEMSGLYDFGARLYHARTGRFISADSVMDGLNAYAYAHNNPLHFVDLDGHQGTRPKPREDTIYIDSEPAFSNRVLGFFKKTGKWLGSLFSTRGLGGQAYHATTSGLSDAHHGFQAGGANFFIDQYNAAIHNPFSQRSLRVGDSSFAKAQRREVPSSLSGQIGNAGGWAAMMLGPMLFDFGPQKMGAGRGVPASRNDVLGASGRFFTESGLPGELTINQARALHAAEAVENYVMNQQFRTCSRAVLDLSIKLSKQGIEHEIFTHRVLDGQQRSLLHHAAIELQDGLVLTRGVGIENFYLYTDMIQAGYRRHGPVTFQTTFRGDLPDYIRFVSGRQLIAPLPGQTWTAGELRMFGPE